MKQLICLIVLCGLCCAQSTQTTASQEGNNVFTGLNTFTLPTTFGDVIIGGVCTGCSSGAGGYATIKNASVAITQRTIINTLGALVCADNAGTLASDCKLATNAAVTNQYLTGIDANGNFLRKQIAYGELSGVPTTFTAAAHNVLSAIHGDATVGTVARGDVITGQGVSPTWTRLPKGTANQVLSMDGTGTDVLWATLAAGGTGTVTSFSSGNLSPIFTTSVATATTTPAQTFALSTAAAHTFLGNNTSGVAAPAYVQPAYTDLSGTVPAVTSVATTAPITGGTITTTGTIACATCVTSTAPGVGIAHFAGATQAVTSSAVDVSGADITGVLKAASCPIMTGDITSPGGTCVTTIPANTIVQADVLNGFVDLSSAQTILGNKIFTNDVTFKSGIPEFDVLAFGALCDFNGATGTDDTVAIQAALTAANAAGKKSRVVFPDTKSCLLAGQLNMDGFEGVELTTSGDSWPGFRTTTMIFTGATGPLISASGTQGIAIRHMGFSYTNASMTGAFIEFGPTQSFEMEVTDSDFLTNGAATTNASTFISLNNTINAVIDRNVFCGAQTAIRGALNNTTFSIVVLVESNTIGSAGAACFSSTDILNPQQSWTIINNDFELGTGAGPKVIDYTAGTWTQVPSSITFLNNWVGDGAVAGSNTLFNFPVGANGISFIGNMLGPASSSVNMFNFGNNDTGIFISSNGTAAGVLTGTFITVGTGVTLNVGSNAYGTISTFMSGTPAGGDVLDNTGLKTFYGPQRNFGQADIIADSAGINTTETIIVKTPAMAANRLIAGTAIRIPFVGTNTSTVANTSTFTLRMGTAGTTADPAIFTSVMAASATTGTNVPFEGEVLCTVRTVGATGTGFCKVKLVNPNATSVATASTGISVIPLQLVLPTMSTFNTTTAGNIISLTYKSAATTTTSIFKEAAIVIDQN